MKLINRLAISLSLLFLLFNAVESKAQADTAFWFAAPRITPGHANQPIVMRFATYGQPATITISEPANAAFVPYTLSLSANSATTIDLTSQIQYIENTPENSVLPYGIKVTATSTISAYYEEEGEVPAGTFNNPEIFPLKGRYAQGTSFVVPSQMVFDDKDALNPLPKNGFIIVATQDSTIVTVTLSDSDAIGHLPGVPFTIQLNKGESYAVTSMGIYASEHLGGSIVQSNKPVCVTIFDDSVHLGSHYDLAGDQIVPEAVTGSEFIMVRGNLNNTDPPDEIMNADFYFIWGTKDSTIISINGSPVGTVNRGKYYQGNLLAPSMYITTSNPVYVLQFTGDGQEVTETSLPAINCTGSQQVSFVRSVTEPFQLNLLCKAPEINSFLLNGASGIITSSFFNDVPGTNGVWKEARINASNMPNIDQIFVAGTASFVTNTSGLFHLGFLNGMNGTGSRLGYFSSYGIGNLTPVVVNSICDNKNVQLQANLISNTTYSWTGPQGFTSNIYDPVITDAQPINSGTYTVTANVQGCGIFTDSLNISVYPLATIAFISPKDTICVGDSAQLTVALTGKAPWTLAYSDGNVTDTISGIAASPFTFSVAPKTNSTYSLTYLVDATPCNPGTVAVAPSIYDTVIVNPIPTVSISGGDSLCTGKSKTLNLAFTAKSPWNLVYNNGADTTTKDSIAKNTFPIVVSPTATTTYTVTSLIDGNGCAAIVPVSYKVNVFDRPIPAFTYTPEICLRDTAFLKDASVDSSQQITNRYWNFGDGTTDTTQNPSKLYTAANTYSISLYTLNNAGCYSDTLTKPIIIDSLPTAAFTYTASPYCETKPIAFTDNSIANSGTLVQWNWNMGNGRTIDTTNGNTFDNTYSTYGDYTVQLMVQNSKGCKSDAVSKTITINPMPQVGFIVPEICLHDAAANFKDTSSIADNSQGQFKYSWSFDASTATPTVPTTDYPSPLSSNSKTPSIKYNYVGNYFVSDTVTSNKGCAAVKTQAFVVNGADPIANFVVVQPNQLCSNDSVLIKNTSTVDFGSLTKLEIYWDYANAPSTIETIVNPADTLFGHLYLNFHAAAGTPTPYTIKVMAYSGGVCESETSQNISLLPSPEVQFLPIEPVCNDSSFITFLGKASELTGISGSSSFSGTGVNGSGIFYPDSVSPGNYYALYTFTTTQGCVDTAGQNIVVLASPQLQMGENVYVLAGKSTEISPISATGDDLVYLWSPTTFLNSTYTDSSATIDAPPNTTVDSIPYILTVTASDGCSIQGGVVAYLLNQPDIPNVFSPNGDGINDTWVIKNLEEYPNPLVQVFDRNGQIVYQQEGPYTPWNGTYNGKPLPVATYYYIINPRNGRPTMSGSVTIIR